MDSRYTLGAFYSTTIGRYLVETSKDNAGYWETHVTIDLAYDVFKPIVVPGVGARLTGENLAKTNHLRVEAEIRKLVVRAAMRG